MPRRNDPTPTTPEPAQEAVARVTLTIPTELLERLDAHAAAETRTRSNAATVLLRQALDRKAG